MIRKKEPSPYIITPTAVRITQTEYNNEADFWNSELEEVSLSGANPTVFKIIWTDRFGITYAKDLSYVYADGVIVPNADAKTFVLLNSDYAKDKDTVRHIRNWWYADVAGSSYVWDWFNEIKEVDPSSFHIIYEELAKDKNNLYGEKPTW